MKKYLFLLIVLMIFQSSLMASDIYSALGISIQEKKTSSKIVIKQAELLNHCKSKKSYTNSLNKLLKYIKSKKRLKETTQYGLGIDYQLSKKVQVMVDFLTELDLNKPSNMMGDREANIKLEISL